MGSAVGALWVGKQQEQACVTPTPTRPPALPSRTGQTGWGVGAPPSQPLPGSPTLRPPATLTGPLWVELC